MNSPPPNNLIAHVLARVREVRRNLGDGTELPEDAGLRFAEALDSMGMVEFLLVLGEDCGVPPECIEQAVQRRFGTVGELAAALHVVGLVPRQAYPSSSPDLAPAPGVAIPVAASAGCWLTATAMQLPNTVQSAAYLNERIQRPPGWLEEHAGIRQRHVWGEQDALAAAVKAAQDCLGRAGISATEVGALLVTSEAPPRLVGLAAALHHRLGMRADAAALEIGGACTGFVAALWLARRLQPTCPVTLIIAVEAPSRFLSLQPGTAGEAAALFGDAAAACLLGSQPATPAAVSLTDVSLGADGGAGDLVQISRSLDGAVAVQLQGQALTVRAIETMAQAIRTLTQQHQLQLSELAAVVMHAGNGRFPALLARHLGLPAERVHSQTPVTGNLGSASLPVAWAALPSIPRDPVIWTAVGAGLTWGAALWSRAFSGACEPV